MACEICGRPDIKGTCDVCLQWIKDMATRNAVSGLVQESFFEGGRFIGERVYDSPAFVSGNTIRSSYCPHRAFWCASCGEIWARIIPQYYFDYQPTLTRVWDLEHRPCPKHGDGQLLYNLPLEGVSPSLIKREAEVLIFTGKL